MGKMAREAGSISGFQHRLFESRKTDGTFLKVELKILKTLVDFYTTFPLT